MRQITLEEEMLIMFLGIGCLKHFHSFCIFYFKLFCRIDLLLLDIIIPLLHLFDEVPVILCYIFGWVGIWYQSGQVINCDYKNFWWYIYKIWYQNLWLLQLFKKYIDYCNCLINYIEFTHSCTFSQANKKPHHLYHLDLLILFQM